MLHRPFCHALALAIAISIAGAGIASADSVRADGDVVTPAIDARVDLGTVAPDAVLTVDVGFGLMCRGLSHVDPGQTVTMTMESTTQPAGGAIVSVGTGSVGPVPDPWVADGEVCPDPAPTLVGSVPSRVVLRAPAVPGVMYEYTVIYGRSLTPTGSDDAGAFGRTGTAVTITLDVVANTPPTLVLPDDRTVEADTTGGWTSSYVVTATDAQDDPPPPPTCLPASGTVLRLGVTTVECTVSDSGGLGAVGSFRVTVQDTTAPVLDPSPRSIAVTTDDPTGIQVSWVTPIALDIADPAPVVTCLAPSGSRFPVGTTTVRCRAQDASGNASTTSFDITATLVPAHTATAVWNEPVSGERIATANRGRILPIKVELFVDGVRRDHGVATLALVPCSDGDVLAVALTSRAGRWQGALDTSRLSRSCYRVSAIIDGLIGGSLELHLRDGGTTARRHDGT